MKKIIMWSVIGLLAVGAIVGLVILSNRKSMDYDPREVHFANDSNGQIDEHYFGNLDSEVVLVEYGSFQCPACATASTRIQALKDEYGDRVLFIFRNFPLSNQPNSRAAAAAVEAAGLQGKYWEMHNLVFARQSEWSRSSAQRRAEQFRGYAEGLGLDIEEWNRDFASNRVRDKINFDLALGREDNVEGTPFFLLNGRALTPQEWGNDSRLRQVLDEEIARVAAENAVGNNNSASGDADQD